MPTWRMVVRTQAPGLPGPGFSTFHWRDAGANIDGDAAAAATALRDGYIGVAREQGTGVGHYFDGRLVEVEGDGLIAVPSWSITGTNNATASDALSPALAVCVTWRTASNSRSGRGRTFLSGWREQHNDAAGTPTSDTLTGANRLITELRDFNSPTGNGAFVVYSPTEGLSRDITGGTVRDVWAVLRSRRG